MCLLSLAYDDCNHSQRQSSPPSVTMITCKQYPVCLMSNQAQPFYHPFWSPSVICPLNWLQSKVWIDWARVNWPQFLVPQAFRQGARLPSWCLIQGPRWRRNSLAVRSLTHTLTRRGCGSGWPRGMRGSGVWAAPPALKSQYNRGQWCDSELCALKWMDRCFLLRAMVKPTITV